jgi:hypothetical protein
MNVVLSGSMLHVHSAFSLPDSFVGVFDLRHICVRQLQE